jgi:hypothetical protein
MSNTLNLYVALASEKARSIENVQDGFDVLLPENLKVGFLKQMEKDGWISSAEIPGKPKEIKMADDYIMIHLEPRQKFIIKDGGRYCYVYDKVTKKSSCVYYVFDN